MENKPGVNDLFRLVVEVGKSSIRLDYNTPSLWIGSCFTENIGSHLQELRFPAGVNPFGVLYNPESIRQSLMILAEEKEFTAGDLRFGNDLWYSFSHHTSFSDPDRDACLRNISESVEKASALLRKARFLFLTFGTARAYRLKETGQVVSNCHKLPHSMFDHELLSAGDITSSYTALISKLSEINPGINIILTLSPVRHWKDGPTENLVSKSVLMVSIAGLAERFDNVSYFPAYEIVMDELRDYRFYEEDMIHINRAGVDYIRKRFMECFVDPAALPLVKEIKGILQGVGHRPFNPSTENHRRFLRSLLDRIGRFEKVVPAAGLSTEREKILHDLESKS